MFSNHAVSPADRMSLPSYKVLFSQKCGIANNLLSRFRHKASSLVAFLLLFPSAASLAAPIGIDEASAKARTWMQGHPVMGKSSHNIQSVEAFPGLGAPYSVYTITLAPTGYLILNSDDRLPLVVAFSADSSLSLDAEEGNSLRAFVEQHVEQHVGNAERQLSQLPDAPARERRSVLDVRGTTSGDELIGPLMETSWSQSHPYNLHAPGYSAGTSYYGYRAPAGCVMTAFAQVLNYHRWPVRGEGSYGYTDTKGTMLGSHAADFSNPYDWNSMQSSYDVAGENPVAAANAVAELVYEMGVAAGANYEGSVTFSDPVFLGKQLTKHFYFEDTVSLSTQATLLPALEDDLRLGYPSVVHIPNHAVVVDGLLKSGGVTTYHINYGWAFTNNGWWAADAVPGGAIERGVTSLVPKLMPFPIQDSVTVEAGKPFELQWLLPKRREQEADKLNLYCRKSSTQPWATLVQSLPLSSRRFSSVISGWDEASNFTLFQKTSSSTNKNWVITPLDFGGAGFFKAAGGAADHLTSISTIIPTATSRLCLRMKYRLASDAFRVLISSDRLNFSPICTVGGSSDWVDQIIDLGAYAGQAIYIRFEYATGNYYAEGGVWVDSISIEQTIHPELEGQPIHFTVVKLVTPGTYEVRAAIVDADQREHTFSPSFTLQVNAGPPTPEINVQQPTGTSLLDGTGKKSFGTANVGQKGTSKTFTIKNTGNAKLSGLKITTDGSHAKDFSVGAPAKSWLIAGESTTFKVNFKPMAKGTRNAAIHLKSNDADESPFDIKLTGLGAPR